MTHLGLKKLFRLSKGFRGKSKNCLRVTAPKVDKALQYAYVERKLKKRDMRRNWIISINAAVREHNLPYSRFIYGLTHSNIELDRKILAELGQQEPLSFKAIVDEVKLQSQVGREVKVKTNNYPQAVKEGLVVEPGSPLPPLEEVKEKAKMKELKWSENLNPPYTPPQIKNQATFDKLKQIEGFESEWEELQKPRQE